MRHFVTATSLCLIIVAAGANAASAQNSPSAIPQAAASGAPMHTFRMSRRGNVTIKVPSFDAARGQVISAAQAVGGAVVGAKTYVDGKGRKHGWVRFKLPQTMTGAFLDSAYRSGKIYSDQLIVSSSDSDFESLQRRVESLQEHERRLQRVLDAPRRMRGSDILYLQERIYRASLDEDALAQQRVDVARDALVSTIEVNMFEPSAQPYSPVASPNIADRFRMSAAIAKAGVAGQAARAATAAAYAAVYAPVWAPLLILAVLVLRWAVKLLISRRTALINIAIAAVHAVRSVMAAVRRIVRAIWEERHRRLFGS